MGVGGHGVGAVLVGTLDDFASESEVSCPFYRNPETAPAGTTTMRIVGGALLIFGALVLSSTTSAWAFVVALAAPVFALVTITVHNRLVVLPSTVGDDDTRQEIGSEAARSTVSSRQPLITTFDEVNWIPTSWGALVVVAVLAVLIGVVVSWLS